ncbi:MAG: redox-regulated ATPase YchF [Thermaerobacter sp.]|nr:redox-regulated ATPase YchF [Thermaerobacter sp.]
MDVGLIGLPQSGKTTIFNLLTGQQAQVNAFGGGKVQSRRALAAIPDRRLDRLAALYRPRKVTAAQLTVVDVPGLGHSEAGGPNRFLQDVRQVDALIHVVRGFPSALAEAPHPLADLQEMELELGLSDLDLLEKRRERIAAGRKVTHEQQVELALVTRLLAALEDGRRLDQETLTEDETRFLRGYQFLTLKPMIWVVNLDDQALQRGDFPDQAKIVALGKAQGIPVVLMAGVLEEEIEALAAEDRAAFMTELGLSESGLARVAQATYERLGLMSFLTAGEDEVRAWTISRGMVAKQAAGRIHSDIERGFIRAEVVAFSDLDQAGSLAKAREQGRVRLEGKDYVMHDGDVVNFRFNV